MFTLLSFSSIPLHHTAGCFILDRRQLSRYIKCHYYLQKSQTAAQDTTQIWCPCALGIQWHFSQSRKIAGTHQNEHLGFLNWSLFFWTGLVLYNWADAFSRKNTFTVLKLIRKSLLLWQPFLSQARCWTNYMCHLFYEFEVKNGYHCNKMWTCKRCEAAFCFQSTSPLFCLSPPLNTVNFSPALAPLWLTEAKY